jgi:hypothetical protein
LKGKEIPFALYFQGKINTGIKFTDSIVVEGKME